jgi:hypothetical protein
MAQGHGIDAVVLGLVERGANVTVLSLSASPSPSQEMAQGCGISCCPQRGGVWRCRRPPFSVYIAVTVGYMIPSFSQGPPVVALVRGDAGEAVQHCVRQLLQLQAETREKQQIMLHSRLASVQ